MSRILLVAALACLLGACAESHGIDEMRDTGPTPPSSDAGLADTGPAADAGSDSGPTTTTPPPTAEPTLCGPNVCYHGEVCCSTLCGWCAPEGSCRTDTDLCD